MEPRIIKSDKELDAALHEIEKLILSRPKPGSAESHRLELLMMLAESYETVRFPIDPPDPISAILFRLEQQGLTRADLIPIIGSRGRVSEVLSGKRALSLAMIRALHEKLGIPASILIRPVRPPRPSAPRHR